MSLRVTGTFDDVNDKKRPCTNLNQKCAHTLALKIKSMHLKLMRHLLINCEIWKALIIIW